MEEKQGDALALSLSLGMVNTMRQMLDGSSVAFGLKDLAQCFIHANREHEILLGAGPGQLHGNKIDSFLPAHEAQAINERVKSVIESGRAARFDEQFTIGGRTASCVTIRFPLRNEAGRIIGSGFIAFRHTPEGEGTAGEHDLLLQAQLQVAELQRLVDDMRHLATTDSLTGLWNRPHLESCLRQEMARLERYSHPLSIVLLDIDHFKAVNDSYGHNTGDAVLKGVAKCLSDSLRNTDLLGRWGGEEFLMILPNTGIDYARLMAERICRVLAGQRFPNVGQVTASFGVAAFHVGETKESAIARADAALYRAKGQGRNRVEVDVQDASDGEAVERIDASFIRLVWKTGYACGHALIDSQHRALFEQSNRLLDAVMNRWPKDDVLGIINELLGDVVQHFRDEEDILRKSAFPDADEHARIHQALVDKALDLAQRYRDDNLSLGELLHYIAYDVVAKHMLTDDRTFFPYLSVA